MKTTHFGSERQMQHCNESFANAGATLIGKASGAASANNGLTVGDGG